MFPSQTRILVHCWTINQSINQSVTVRLMASVSS